MCIRDSYRNGYKRKRVNSSYGAMEIEVPQDRKSTFEPQVVKKRQKEMCIRDSLRTIIGKITGRRLWRLQQTKERQRRLHFQMSKKRCV